VIRVVSFTAAIVTVALAGGAPAAASCIPSTAEERIARADVVFDGVALEGSTASGRQRFQVRHYVKGDGPDVVQVATGVTRRPDGSGSLTSVSIDVRAGESWRIYGDRTAGDGIVTSNCAGSRPLPPEEIDGTAAAGDSRFGGILVAAVALLAVAATVLLSRFRRARHAPRGLAE